MKIIAGWNPKLDPFVKTKEDKYGKFEYLDKDLIRKLLKIYIEYDEYNMYIEGYISGMSLFDVKYFKNKIHSLDDLIKDFKNDQYL